MALQKYEEANANLSAIYLPPQRSILHGANKANKLDDLVEENKTPFAF